MKRGMTTANAIVLAVIIIGSVFIVSLFGELGGEDITIIFPKVFHNDLESLRELKK